MISSKSILALATVLLLGACDPEADPAAALPPATGEGAPKQAELPVPADAQHAAATQTVDHRWIGSAQAKHHVELAPKMTGTIAAIEVAEGDKVTKGQLLFRVEGTMVRLAVAQAATGVAAAEIQVSEAEREADRTGKLAAKGSIGSANLDRAQGGVDAAKAGLKQAKAAASLARAQTNDLSVESPIDGIVTAKLKSVGELATMMPPTIVLVIDDLSIIEVRVRVPELKLREITVGSPVTVHFPALDLAVDVPITRIGNAVDPRTRTIELIIDVPNPEMRIKSGMSVELELGKKPADTKPVDSEPAGGEPSDAKPAKPAEPAVAPTAMIVNPAVGEPSKLR
ncbi:efflux RND transporter periplasmic adaptor subunit [Nannocystaceae bacterium ST9]